MGTDSLLEAVRHHVADLGFELIEFQRSGPPQRPSIKVRIDRPDSGPGHGVTAGDCARVSRVLEKFFEGDGGIGRCYLLQVSSPGLERPVRFTEHWLLRGTWDRVTTTNDRDTDIFMLGIGYRF